jgi:hypothetical protein
MFRVHLTFSQDTLHAFFALGWVTFSRGREDDRGKTSTLKPLPQFSFLFVVNEYPFILPVTQIIHQTMI